MVRQRSPSPHGMQFIIISVQHKRPTSWSAMIAYLGWERAVMNEMAFEPPVL